MISSFHLFSQPFPFHLQLLLPGLRHRCSFLIRQPPQTKKWPKKKINNFLVPTIKKNPPCASAPVRSYGRRVWERARARAREEADVDASAESLCRRRLYIRLRPARALLFWWRWNARASILSLFLSLRYDIPFSGRGRALDWASAASVSPRIFCFWLFQL